MQNTLIDFSDCGLLSISGPDAKKFLQGQLTCDVAEISTHQHTLAAHCNPQGRVISLFRLFLWQDQYFLRMPKECIPQAAAALKKYAVFYKTNLQEKNDTYTCLGVSGNCLEKLLSEHLTLPQKNNEAIASENLFIMKVAVNNSYYEIWGKHEDVKHLHEVLQRAQPTTKKRVVIDVENGIPTIYQKTSECFLPHELNLHLLNAISFKKGCYTGQEIIARMHYLGKLKKHLYSLEGIESTSLLVGEDFSNQGILLGNIVDFAEVSYNKYKALIISDEKVAQNNNMTLVSYSLL